MSSCPVKIYYSLALGILISHVTTIKPRPLSDYEPASCYELTDAVVRVIISNDGNILIIDSRETSAERSTDRL